VYHGPFHWKQINNNAGIFWLTEMENTNLVMSYG
jgi:hypothetical protein